MRRLNERDDSLLRFAKLLNRIALISCWGAVFGDFAYLMVTENLTYFLLMSLYTPIRYFLFDIAPQKDQKRPTSLDRSIPLAIFVRYLSVKFPIAQGNLMADLWGFLLALCRAYINGYALLWFDTFTFAYAVRDDAKRVPLKKDIRLLHEEERLEQADQKADALEDARKAQEIHDLTKAWRETQQAQELSQWSFPLRRYLKPGDDFYALREVGAELLDDKNQLDQKAYKAYKEKQKSETKRT